MPDRADQGQPVAGEGEREREMGSGGEKKLKVKANNGEAPLLNLM